ncbi:MAG: glycosyltransferase family 25 protein [Burkholderiaceae bacterium]
MQSDRSPLRRFDAVFIINLASRTDRKREMQQQLRQIGVDPALAPVTFFEAVRPADAGGFPSLGARGCFMSHLGVLRQARAAGHRTILLLEDDVNFARDFPAGMRELDARLDQRGWDLAYLGALSVTPAPAHAGKSGPLPPASAVVGSHMLAIDAGIVPDLIDYLEAMLRRPPGDPAGGPMHMDGAYNRYRQSRPALRTLICTPPLGTQRPSRTDVAALKWFDRMPAVRSLVAGIRRARAGSR